MNQSVTWTTENVVDFNAACRLLTSASGCIGLRDKVAHELVQDALQLLQRIAARGSAEAVEIEATPSGIH